MKFSEQWLRQWVSPALETQALADQITMAGLEVDAVEPVAPPFTQVVVGLVTDKMPHPDADKLNVCQLADGSGQPVQVVCGAPNVAVGQKVAFAQVGSVLPGDVQIGEAKIRGQASFGMICSESELGLAEETSSGILVLNDEAPVGMGFRDFMNLDDMTLEVDLTPNRGDCLSLQGIAREVGALNQLDVHSPDCAPVEVSHEAVVDVKVLSPSLCPRYIGRVIDGVDVSQDTPLWMVERLRRSGIRSLDPVVDVTNYVMLELGQPLHAFDREHLHGSVTVRLPYPEETLTLLDGQRRHLGTDTLLIADDQGPLAMAGVMGGERSGINAQTRTIFLESAFFTPLSVAGQARAYGLHTDASHRFERGVDPELAQVAIERASRLLIDICGGNAGPLSIVEDEAQLPEKAKITLSAERLHAALGKAIDAHEVTEILERLGFQVKGSGGKWEVVGASWRFDIAIEEDLIEEVARLHGYNRLPVRRPVARLALETDNEGRTPLHQLRRCLVARGYQEAVTYSFVAPELQQALLPEAVAPRLANPISADLSVMRASLFPGLVRALQHNLNRQHARVRLFETGLVFNGALDDLVQAPMVGGIACGALFEEGWSSERRDVDFFDVKGDLESLMEMGGEAQAFRMEPARHSALHPGQSARLLRDGVPVGWLGTLHPGVRAKLDLKCDVVLFEVELDALLPRRLPSFSALSRFPEVRRDLAFIVTDTLPVQALVDLVRRHGGSELKDVVIFDVYAGKGVSPGDKSVAMGLTWQHPSRTLNDDEINKLLNTIVDEAGTALEARLRA